MRQTLIYIAAVGFALCAAMVLSVGPAPADSLPLGATAVPGYMPSFPTHDSRAPVPLGVLTATPVPQTSTLVRQVAASSDDAGNNPVEPYNCRESTTYNEVYLGFCENRMPIFSGFRFEDVRVPRDSSIIEAYLDFIEDGPYTAKITVYFWGDDEANPPTFSINDPPSERPRTSARSTPWAIRNEWQLGTPTSSPPLANVVQELIDSPNWYYAGPMALVVGSESNGRGHRRVIAIDRGINAQAQLRLNFNAPVPSPSLDCATSMGRGCADVFVESLDLGGAIPFYGARADMESARPEVPDYQISGMRTAVGRDSLLNPGDPYPFAEVGWQIAPNMPGYGDIVCVYITAMDALGYSYASPYCLEQLVDYGSREYSVVTSPYTHVNYWDFRLDGVSLVAWPGVWLGFSESASVGCGAETTAPGIEIGNAACWELQWADSELNWHNPWPYRVRLDPQYYWLHSLEFQTPYSWQVGSNAP